MAKKVTAPKRKQRSDRKGFKAVLVRLREDQDQALTREALRRAVERSVSRPDKSEIVREALDAHPRLKGRGRP